MSLHLSFIGAPKPKQSTRFGIKKGKNGKMFATAYQEEGVKKEQREIGFLAKLRLPKGFIPWDQPIGLKALFVFPVLKKWSQKKKDAIHNGDIIVYKQTKPDLQDNLMKCYCDALEGIVYVNDSRIAKVESTKIYGRQPRVEFDFYELEQQDI